MVWTQRNHPFLWSPWQTLLQLQDSSNRFTGRAFGAPLTSASVNVHASDDELILRALVPGYRSEDIQLQLEGGVLTLRGEQSSGDESDSNDATTVSFERRFRMPFRAAADDVQARLEDGVLEVRVPRAEADKKRSIVIEG